jgi:hypothetical protein
MPWTDILLASLAGAVALFVWSAIAWMGLPHHHGDFRPIPGDDDLAAALARAKVGPGVYMMPHFLNFEGGFKDPALAQRFERGPNATITVIPPGPCMRGSTFLKGLLLDVLIAFSGAVIYHFTAGGLGGTVRTIVFFACLGAFVNGAPTLAQVVWMSYPLRNALTVIFDGVVGFALLGLVLRLVMS